MSGSPEEREIEVGEILPESIPRIVLCSTQYREDITETFDYFFRQGYEVFVQWLNLGYSDDTPYDDNFFLRDYLLENSGTIQIRDGQPDPTYRLKEIRQFIFSWASYRNLIFTNFP